MARWLKQELSYCSNVHPGDSLAEVRENIEQFIASVRHQRGLKQLHAGLWLSHRAANELASSPDNLQQFAELLDDSGIALTSLNGFPYGDFHQPVVKEKVYLPHWGEKARLDYTLQLAKLLAVLLPEGIHEGSISTLPLGFADHWDDKAQQQAERLFADLLEALEQLERDSGKQIRVCIEMEPGCALETTPQLIRFFTECLPEKGIPENKIQRYLGACYDICHQAVMFEDIEQSLMAIHQAGIVIGKIQISNALRIPNAEQARALLVEYAEPRYLHQTCSEQQFRLDLNQALDDTDMVKNCEWRTHFHVPIQAEQLSSPLLNTTRSAIEDTSRFLAAHPELKPHLEVETYTWGVMPESLRPNNDRELVNCIAEELNWLQNTLASFNLLGQPIN